MELGTVYTTVQMVDGGMSVLNDPTLNGGVGVVK